MKLQTLLLLPLTALIAWTASGQVTASIPIMNPIFTEDQLQCEAGPNCDQFGITGWLVGPQTTVLKASTGQYSGAPSTGLYVASIGNQYSTGSILQTLGATVQANTIYSLKLVVGARADYPFTGCQGALLAGNVVLASRNSVTPVGGTFVTFAIVYSSGANPPSIGKAPTNSCKESWDWAS